MKSILISTLALLGFVSVAYGVGEGFKQSYIEQLLAEANREEELKVSQRTDDESLLPNLPRTMSCPTTGSYPTSVHRLRPQDIEIIGAVGDSLTAANGAKANSILFLITEYRGVSWAMGCEAAYPKVVTFASILKSLSPNLYGCSTGSGNQNSSAAVLNLAHPGHTSFDTLQHAKFLLKRLEGVNNWSSKWKLVNFFIGGNDLCDVCHNPLQTPENFANNIRETLDFMKANMPRTLVNLVLTLDVTGIEILDGSTCRNMQNSFCDCALHKDHKEKVKSYSRLYQQKVRDIIDTNRYDDSDLFTVSVHEFMSEMSPPLLSDGKPDRSYFAPDCFHFSEKGHQAAGIELWNSLLTHHEERNNKWTIGQSPQCPSLIFPYFHTRKNGNALKNLLVN